jgi:hypothetical protein
MNPLSPQQTDLGRQALEADAATPPGNGNGNGHAKPKAPPGDGLDPLTRKRLDDLAEILSRGNRNWCDIDVLIDDWGLKHGFLTNAVGLQPQRFQISHGRLFLLSEQKEKNPQDMNPQEYDAWLHKIDPSLQFRRARKGYSRGGGRLPGAADRYLEALNE